MILFAINMKKLDRLLFKIKKRGLGYIWMPKSSIIFKAYNEHMDKYWVLMFYINLHPPTVQKILDLEIWGRQADRLRNLWLKYNK